MEKKEQEVEVMQLDPKIEYIKMFGLQRSGTNYLTHLLNENFENVQVLVNVGGWKHGHYAVPWILGKEIHCMAVTKNPYSWLVSMYNYWGPNRKLNIGPDLRGVTFENFVKNRAVFEKQRGVPFLYRCSNPVQHWNNMNFHWLSIRFNSKRLCMITYETLLQDLPTSLKNIGETLELKRKSEEIIASDKTFVPAGEDMRTSEEGFDKKNFYLQGGFLDFYTPELLDFVNNEVDLNLMVHFGYNILTPEILEEYNARKESK